MKQTNPQLPAWNIELKTLIWYLCSSIFPVKDSKGEVSPLPVGMMSHWSTLLREDLAGVTSLVNVVISHLSLGRDQNI